MTESTNTQTQNLNALNLNVSAFKNTVCLQLGLSRWGNRRTLPKQLIIQLADQMARAEGITDEEQLLKRRQELEKRLSSTSKLIVCEELKAIEDFQNWTKRNVLAYSIPKSRPSKAKKQKQKSLDEEAEEMVVDYDTVPEGFYLYPVETAPQIDQMIKDAMVKIREDLVPDLAAVWDSKVAEAKAALEQVKAWRDELCPPMSELRNQWCIRHRWISFTVPEGLPEELREAEQKKMAEAMQEQAKEIVLALRESFMELIASTKDILEVQPGQKAKKLYPGRIEDVKLFIETFNNRNIFNDRELEALVEQARAIMVGVDRDKLKNSTTLRNNVAEKFESIKESLARLVVVDGQRALDLSED